MAGTRGHAGQKHSLCENHRQPLRKRNVESGTHARTAHLIDKLICGAYIEARSCERFAALAPWLDEDLQTFYLSLLRSEARHYQDYLALAQQISAEDISARVRYFGDVEADLILSPDREFRFHSGVPAAG